MKPIGIDFLIFENFPDFLDFFWNFLIFLNFPGIFGKNTYETVYLPIFEHF